MSLCAAAAAILVSASTPTNGRKAAFDAARRLAHRTGAVVTVSGAVDLVTDGARVVRIRNGHSMMTRVTGLGCGATAITGACLAVTDPMAASVHGSVLLGLASELAAERARGPGSVRVELLDALYRLDDAMLLARALIEEGAAIGA